MFTDREIEKISEYQLSVEALPSDLICRINGVDLSWRDEIPMLDYSRSLFLALTALSPENPIEQFVSPELIPWTYVRLGGGDLVTVSRQGVEASATCPRRALISASALLGIKSYELFSSRYPAIKSNAIFKDWFPLAEMLLHAALRAN